jgi:hypothetical protein
MLNSNKVNSKRANNLEYATQMVNRLTFSAHESDLTRNRDEMFLSPKTSNVLRKANISEQPGKPKDLVIVTPFVNNPRGNELEVATIRVKFKDENLPATHADNRSTASKTIENQSALSKFTQYANERYTNTSGCKLFSAISSISLFQEGIESISNFHSEISFTEKLDLCSSTRDETEVKLDLEFDPEMKAVFFNHPKLPVGKENSEAFKMKLINKEFKTHKHPLFNSAAKKRKYNELYPDRLQSPSRKYSKTGSVGKIFRSTIDFTGADGKLHRFRVFQDPNVIKNVTRYSGLLVESEFDDDVESDDEQMRLAKMRIERHLRNGIEDYKKLTN